MYVVVSHVVMFHVFHISSQVYNSCDALTSFMEGDKLVGVTLDTELCQGTLLWSRLTFHLQGIDQ